MVKQHFSPLARFVSVDILAFTFSMAPPDMHNIVQRRWYRFKIRSVRKILIIKMQEVSEHVTTSFKATDDQ